MIITIPGANFASAGLGRITRLINGMPAAGLLGLYLMDEGTVGSATPGTISDRSGNGNHMELYTGRTAPTKRSYGAEVNDVHGVIWETPIPAGRSGITVITAMKPLLPGGETNVYQSVFSSSANTMPASKTGSHTTPNYPVVNFYGAATAEASTWGAYDASATMLAGRVSFSDAPRSETAAVVAATFDGANSRLRMASNASGATLTVNDADFATFFDGTPRGNVMLGCWPNGLVRTAEVPQAEIYGFAVYDTLSDLAVAEAIARMKAICVARGVSF